VCACPGRDRQADQKGSDKATAVTKMEYGKTSKGGYKKQSASVKRRRDTEDDYDDDDDDQTFTLTVRDTRVSLFRDKVTLFVTAHCKDFSHRRSAG
jgi:hypothetical protein